MELIAIAIGLALNGAGLIWATITGQKNGKLEQRLKATEDALYVEKKSKEFVSSARDRAIADLERFKKLVLDTDSGNLNSLFPDAPEDATHTDSSGVEESTINQDDDRILSLREEDQSKKDN